MMVDTWAYRIHKFSDGTQEKFEGLFIASYLTFEILDKVALSQNDDQAAEQLQKERSKLFKTINERDLKSG